VITGIHPACLRVQATIIAGLTTSTANNAVDKFCIASMCLLEPNYDSCIGETGRTLTGFVLPLEFPL